MNTLTRLSAADLLRTMPGVQTVATADSLTVIMPTDSYTLLVGPPVQVLDADGDAVKMLFGGWQEAVDYVLAALKPQAA